MRESDVRKKIVAALKSLDAQAVENPINPGTPDIEFIGGWVEVKYVPKWPKRETTPIRIDHFTAQQRIWIKKRIAAGGKVFVLVRVEDEYFLFRGEEAAEGLGTWNRSRMNYNSLFSSGLIFNEQGFRETILSNL